MRFGGEAKVNFVLLNLSLPGCQNLWETLLQREVWNLKMACGYLGIPLTSVGLGGTKLAH